MHCTKNVGIIIPSLSPDERLISIVREIINEGYKYVLIVDDGSDEKYKSFFDDVEQLGGTVVHHAVNLGKGRAIKTAFNYILTNWPQVEYGITADSDGQHTVTDINKCVNALIDNQDKLVLGSRNFSGENIPFRSRFGNKLTSKVMKILVGVSINDTQTGLRGMSRDLMKKYLAVDGERFEYEMNMLLYSKEMNISIVEVPIETIYLEENKSSHFRPFQDSIKIYGLFLRFIVASLSSFVIDIGLFSLATFLLRGVFPEYYIIVSTIIARVISSVYNFFMNRHGVFKSNDHLGKTMIKYYTLAVLQMSISAVGVWALCGLWGNNETLIKIIVDCLLFVISFQIQREWVFKKRK